MSTKYDAIVAGAGPSGATAAYELSKAGMRTLLVEKARLPRYKTCGGGVTFKVATALADEFPIVAERTIYKVDFSWKTTRPFVAASEEPLVYMVQRSRFDNYLAERAVRAGAELMDETAVTAVDVGQDRIEVDSSRGRLVAGYLIGADGATGRVARSLGLMANREAMPALESELEADPATMEYWSDKIGLDLGTLQASYGWVFPKGDHLSVGVGGYPFLDDFGTRLKEYDRAHTAARVPGVKRVIRSHGYLLPLRRPGAPVHKGRALLVGDAAGLVEAFTGEGIYWAVRSAQIAAQTLIEGERGEEYQRRLDRELTPDLLAARRWWHVYLWAPRICYSLPKRSSFFWRAVCRILRGERHFTDIGRALGPVGFVESMLPTKLLPERPASSPAG